MFFQIFFSGERADKIDNCPMPPTKGKGKGGKGASPKGKGKAIEAMTPHGDGASSLSSHANQRRIFGLFLVAATITDHALKAKAGTTFDDMPEEVACSQDIYAFFCTYLTYVYVIGGGAINAGQHLDHTSAKSIWSGIINQANVKWSATGKLVNLGLMVRAYPASAARPSQSSRANLLLSNQMCVALRRVSLTA